MASEPDLLSGFDFFLPPERVAQRPPVERDGGRLMVLDRAAPGQRHTAVKSLTRWLRAGDLLVVNATRVLPARLRGAKSSGGNVEALILGPASADEPGEHFRALLRCGGRLRPGLKLELRRGDRRLGAEVCALGERGEVTLRFAPGVSPYPLGEAPLPPYIARPAEIAESDPEADARDLERYQTIFARVPGAVAAPTAGLHLSERLLDDLKSAGVECAELVLHVGPGTFRPLQREQLESGRLPAERFELPPACAAAVTRARARGGRVVAVGTTSVRVLESCAVGESGSVAAASGETELFLRPGSRFRVVDAMLTNFHLPRSSLLLLVSAFAGRAHVLRAYAEAIARGYRFYSYGDAMLIL